MQVSWFCCEQVRGSAAKSFVVRREQTRGFAVSKFYGSPKTFRGFLLRASLWFHCEQVFWFAVSKFLVSMSKFCVVSL